MNPYSNPSRHIRHVQNIAATLLLTSHIAISDKSMSLISTTLDANDLHERVQVSRPSRIVGLHSAATEPTNQRHCQCHTPPRHLASAAWSDIVNHADTKRYVKRKISLAECGTCHNQNAGEFRAFEKAVDVSHDQRSRVSRHVWTFDTRAARIPIRLFIHMVQWSAV